MNPAHLLARVRECGFRVEVTADGPRLVPTVEGAILPRDLLADLKRHRESLVAFLTACMQCGRPTDDAENRERLKGVNPFCSVVNCPYRR